MSRAVAIMIAFRAQRESVQSARLAHGAETFPAAGKQFMNVGLVTYVKDKPVRRSVEDVMHSQRQFHDAEVRPKVAARLR